MQKLIYTQRVEVVDSYQERRDCADQRIAEFLFLCGFVPIPIPNVRVIAEDIVNAINPDGIVLTGGNSLLLYGGNAPERDELDSYLIDYAIKNSIPLYGFCRGMQSILHYFGNKLVFVHGHVAIRHTINGSLGKLEVNSYHNQGCIELNKNSELDILARAEDGVIEAIRHKKYPIMGTMWHPEREESYKEDDIQRMKGLFVR